MNRVCRARAGVSLLLEALLGIGLFGTVMLVVFSLFPSTHASLAQARRYTEAVNLAREHADLVRALGFPTGAPPVPALPQYVPSMPVPVSVVVDGQPSETLYQVAVNRTMAGTAPDDLCLINVTVSWDEGTGIGTIRRQVQVDTAVSQH